MLFLCFAVRLLAANQFQDFINKGNGDVVVYYFPIEPFIYQDEMGNLRGIEKEMMDSFFKFVEKKYQLKLFIEWRKVPKFEDIFKYVQESKDVAFGVSIISKTEKRAMSVAFSNAYMPDVSVFISHLSVPYLKNGNQLKAHIDGFEAATISNSTYMYDMDYLVEKYDLKLDYVDVPNDQNIIELVSRNKTMVGYVGLPFYVIEISKGNPVKRHGAFQVKRDGYRFIYQLNNGWEEVVKNYFDSYLYRAEADKIIRNYLGNDYSELIWGLASDTSSDSQNDEIAFLNREKEIQSQSLIAVRQQQDFQRLIIISISIGLLLVVIIVALLIRTNRLRTRDNLLLVDKSKQLQDLLDQLNQQKDEITFQRQLLQKKNQELTEINKQKDDLIGIVAHDLKSPINQMSGLITILGFKNDKWNNEELEIYDRIESSNRHLKELVERILDLEAIQMKSLNFQMAEVDMTAILRETLLDFNEKANSKHIKFDTAQLKNDCLIMADSFFLRQVFENLISNSLKFSPYNSTVYVGSELVKNHYHIYIKDEGPGISKTDHTKLFSKYMTLSAKPTGDETSTGLGLSIVKKYVEGMNGSVWCESKQGNGAKFTVAFQKVK